MSVDLVSARAGLVDLLSSLNKRSDRDQRAADLQVARDFVRRFYQREAPLWKRIEEALGGAEAARQARVELLHLATVHVLQEFGGDDRLSSSRVKGLNAIKALALALAEEIERDREFMLDIWTNALESRGIEASLIWDPSPLRRLGVGAEAVIATIACERGSKRQRHETWMRAADIYWRTTGRRPATSKPKDQGQPCGPFVRFMLAFYAPLANEKITPYMVEDFVDRFRSMRVGAVDTA